MQQPMLARAEEKTLFFITPTDYNRIFRAITDELA
jgi:hypothetical protein